MSDSRTWARRRAARASTETGERSTAGGGAAARRPDSSPSSPGQSPRPAPPRAPPQHGDAATGSGGVPDGRVPLLRNAYALMINTGVSGVLGLGYWIVAARYYTPDAVGQGSAAIAAMKFLAGLTAVTLIGSLARFVPIAGHRTRQLVLRTYGVSAALVAFATTVFLLTVDLWGSSYAFLRGWLPGLGFLLAVLAWTQLTLQDGVLTGLRRAIWVPVGNTVFSLGKLALLVLLAGALPATGVFVSWAAAIALSMVPLCWLIFRRFIPRHMARAERGVPPPGYREMGRFLAGDYTGALFSLAVVYMVPVLVAAQVSAADNAYFYITVTIAGTVNLLGVNMGASLTVEGAHDPNRLAVLTQAALRRMARVMVPLCLIMFFLAPQILNVFGRGYAEAAGPLLRWYAVAALLRSGVEIYFAVLRARSRTTQVAILQGVLCALVLGLTMTLIPLLGLVGAGIAETVALVVVGLPALFGMRGVLRGSRRSPRPGGGAADPASGKRPPAPTSPRRATPTARPPPMPATPPSPAEAEDRSAQRGRLSAVVALWLLLALALTLFWLPLRTVSAAEVAEVGGLGLIEAFPKLTLLGGALLVVCFAAALCSRRPPVSLLVVVVVATAICLHAVPAVLEEAPRFATAWQHLGFIEYLERKGTTAPHLDARWSWPGFFAVASLVGQATGVGDFTEVLRWWPVGFALACLLPMALLLRAVQATWRAKWCALWFFVLCGWVGQDYFSPQAFTYLLYLAFLAVLWVWFQPPPSETLRTGRRRRTGRAPRRRPGEAPAPPPSRGVRLTLLALLLALFAVAVSSHQLTPFVMLGVLTALVWARRSVLTGLPLLYAALLAGWIVFLAEPYWSGHLQELFGGIGGLSGNVSSSVSGRVEGGSEIHKLVLYTRMMLAAGVLALAGWGLLRRRRRGVSDRVALIATAVPFLAVGLQSYGGEMALRVFLFSLPGACVLAAFAFFPQERDGEVLSKRSRAERRETLGVPPRQARRDRPPAAGRRPWLAPGAALLAGLVLFGGFLVARWGNEAFEQVRPGEVAAMEYVYEHDQPTARLLWLSGNPEVEVTPALPWGSQDVERVKYKPVLAPPKPADPGQIDDLVQELRDAGPGSFLMVNRGQSTFLELDSGYPPQWPDQLTEALDEHKELDQAFTDEDATVYTLAEQPGESPPEATTGQPGPDITWTPWSLAGALSLTVSMALLAVREFLRVRAGPGIVRESRLDWLLWCSLPLLCVTVISMVSRFLTLS